MKKSKILQGVRQVDGIPSGITVAAIQQAARQIVRRIMEPATSDGFEVKAGGLLVFVERELHPGRHGVRYAPRIVEVWNRDGTSCPDVLEALQLLAADMLTASTKPE